jgi:hypothetical protein
MRLLASHKPARGISPSTAIAIAGLVAAGRAAAAVAGVAEVIATGVTVPGLAPCSERSRGKESTGQQLGRLCRETEKQDMQGQGHTT